MRNISPAQYLAAIEENLSAWVPAFGKLGQAYVSEPPAVNRSLTDIPIALFNSVMDARLAPEHTETTIQAVISAARARNVPLMWWVVPSTQPADLGQRLEKHGFVFDDESPGMAIALDQVDARRPGPAGFAIRPAQDAAAQRQWSHLMELGFGATVPNELGMNTWCNLLRLAGPETFRPYIGWLDDQPVATALLFQGAGVAGIYSIAILPEVRRRGIGAAMTHHTLLQARSLGYKIGVLQASEMGLGVYRALGFQEYCRITAYLWQPPK